MALPIPATIIPRRVVETPPGEAGLWAKMFDPPKLSPGTPELLDLLNLPTINTINGSFQLRANPVPEVMQAAGLATVSVPHTVQLDLMHGMKIPGWDGKLLTFFVFRSKDIPFVAGGSFPAMTVRVPQGAIFHGQTLGHGPPPHTIHWHGIEPTPINDGVGHCSMEIGNYTYQWQPNFMGFYFYHCHRNTVQHFEFGLYGAMIFHAKDAFFATQFNPSIPIGAGRDGLFRASANLSGTSLNALQDPALKVPLSTADPWSGDPFLKFSTHPHAYTVPYDVEALLVVDDRDSVWSDFAPDPRAFFPKHGNKPVFNGLGQIDNLTDKFVPGFFNDYNADNWFVTGVLVPNAPGVDGIISTTAAVPPAQNSGVATQVAINIPDGGGTGKTVLIRCLDAAYNFARITFPKDVTIIAFDGRALGVPPYGNYNNAFDLAAGTPILLSTARRFDALMRFAPGTTFTSGTSDTTKMVKVEFLDTQGGTQAPGPLLKKAFIPINVTNA